jgi:hypothetical protein
MSATRDNFTASGAIFSMTSIQALICSVAGGVIIVTGLISIFIKNQNMKKSMLFVIFALFMIQVLTVEISRPIMLI